MIVKAPLGQTLGEARMFDNLELAVEHYRLGRQ
jgi:hypothetical protein